MASKFQPVCLSDFEKYAFETLPRNALDYYRSGANNEQTLQENLNAFTRYKFRPRFLRDVSNRDLSTTVLGHKISFPVCIAPTAMNKMAHPEGELAAAKAAAEVGIGFTLSTISTTSIEDIVQNVPDGLHFFQLYIFRNRDVTLQLLKRVEKSGFKALLLTVDTPLFGKRLSDNRNKFTLPPHLKMANFEAFDAMGSRANRSEKQSGLNEYANALFNPSLTWNDIKWLKQNTKLPIVLKGVLTASDALKAVEAGVAGILVSNHGARQLDGVPSTIDALREVVQAVGGRCEVYLDGGVRLGTDVLKAVAMGAQAVFIGRPAIYAMAYDGANGVKTMLDILKEEFDTSLALSGCTSVKNIDPNLVVHESYYLSKL